MAKLAADCPNLIGFKDGVGDIEQLTGIRSAIGDRLLFINGMPTAETYARSFRGIGIPTYSSAILRMVAAGTSHSPAAHSGVYFAMWSISF